MKTLLALDSFKGCLSAAEAVDAAASALQGQQTVRFPLSDGGEGFTECVVTALGGRFRTVTVHDPLGRPVQARYGLVQDGRIAVIETAAASGLCTLLPSELDPWNASSKGTGELMRDAVEQGARTLWVGLGGTAVMDAGAGLLDAFPAMPEGVSLHAFHDVDVPLTGPSGAAAVFGPQKGADGRMVGLLERRFCETADRWKMQYGVDADAIPGAGAAGGIGAALAICLGARMHAGISSVLEMTGFRKHLEGCGLVVTGEGKADRQTLAGKVPFGVLETVREHAPQVPVVLIAGKVEDRGALLAAGFDAVIQITPPDELMERAMEKTVAVANLRQAVQGLPYFGNQH